MYRNRSEIDFCIGGILVGIGLVEFWKEIEEEITRRERRRKPLYVGIGLGMVVVVWVVEKWFGIWGERNIE